MINDEDLHLYTILDKAQEERKMVLRDSLFDTNRQILSFNGDVCEGHDTKYYNGFFKDGMKHGIGQEVYYTNQLFFGHFFKGHKNGPGIYQGPRGKSIMGITRMI